MWRPSEWNPDEISFLLNSGTQPEAPDFAGLYLHCLENSVQTLWNIRPAAKPYFSSPFVYSQTHLRVRWPRSEQGIGELGQAPFIFPNICTD